jgi:hypothetical protein
LEAATPVAALALVVKLAALDALSPFAEAVETTRPWPDASVPVGTAR